MQETIIKCIDNLSEQEFNNLYYEMEYEETHLILKAENDLLVSEMIPSGGIRVSYKENNHFLYWINENERKVTNDEDTKQVYVKHLIRQRKMERICK